MDRYTEACLAADRIINMVESAGFDITDPYSIINCTDFSATPDDMQYAYGASRIVIWDEDYCDYVIKIALDECYEKYCQHEVEVYHAAMNEGIEDSFAWCMCYSEPCEDEDSYKPGIYVMEYLDCDEDTVYDSAWRYGFEEYCETNGLDSSSVDSIDSYNDWNCGEDNKMIMEYFTSDMDMKYRVIFEIFLNEWCITDLHMGNWGLKNDKMKIVDYAGWAW